MRYHLEAPEEHDGRAVLVVGGGDSALEAALAVAERPGTRVTLCHRGARFTRAKPANVTRVEEAVRRGALRLLLGAPPRRPPRGGRRRQRGP